MVPSEPSKFFHDSGFGFAAKRQAGASFWLPIVIRLRNTAVRAASSLFSVLDAASFIAMVDGKWRFNGMTGAIWLGRKLVLGVDVIRTARRSIKLGDSR
ncbi:hypothetical protein CGZ80_09545 [Rhodopirellula sp. MGV]|nr:hypothetical protein CGZ80_09545 [Rhodopirellula sp. MGV]PNY36650.1 hypothetical protein C2E31_12460 [Rhodopirellula baltica]